MGRRNRFRPTADLVESRLLLSMAAMPMVHGGRPALVRRVDSRTQVAQIFDAFRVEYGAARNAYLAGGATAPALTSLQAYTNQRVYELSQELSGVLGRVASTSPRKKDADGVRSFLNNRILSTQSTGSLLGGLLTSTPPAGSTPATSSLYIMAADSAIDGAETSTLNAVTSLRTGLYSKSHGRH